MTGGMLCTLRMLFQVDPRGEIEEFRQLLPKLLGSLSVMFLPSRRTHIAASTPDRLPIELVKRVHPRVLFIVIHGRVDPTERRAALRRLAFHRLVPLLVRVGVEEERLHTRARMVREQRAAEEHGTLVGRGEVAAHDGSALRGNVEPIPERLCAGCCAAKEKRSREDDSHVGLAGGVCDERMSRVFVAREKGAGEVHEGIHVGRVPLGEDLDRATTQVGHLVFRAEAQHANNHGSVLDGNSLDIEIT